MSGIRASQLEFIRHGLPEGGNRYRGNAIDDVLSETGWQQMWTAMGDDADWDLIISSPMQRCLPFAQAMAQKIGVDVRVESDFREIGFGSWEGKTKTELISRDEAAFYRFYQNPLQYPPQGAEGVQQFYQRVSSLFDHLCKELQGQRVLVVAHAGIMRACLVHTLNSPLTTMYRINIPYAKRLGFDTEDVVKLQL